MAHRANGPGQQLLPGVAEEIAKGLIHLDEPAAGAQVNHCHADRSLLKRDTEPFFAVPQRAFQHDLRSKFDAPLQLLYVSRPIQTIVGASFQGFCATFSFLPIQQRNHIQISAVLQMANVLPTIRVLRGPVEDRQGG